MLIPFHITDEFNAFENADQTRICSDDKQSECYPKASGNPDYLVVVVSFVTFTPSGPASVPTLEVTVLVFVSPFSSVTLVETLKEEELEKLQAESVKSIRTASARRISFFALFFMVVCSPLI